MKCLGKSCFPCLDVLFLQITTCMASREYGFSELETFHMPAFSPRLSQAHEANS